jgi:hypothetical protein
MVLTQGKEINCQYKICPTKLKLNENPAVIAPYDCSLSVYSATFLLDFNRPAKVGLSQTDFDLFIP